VEFCKNSKYVLFTRKAVSLIRRRRLLAAHYFWMLPTKMWTSVWIY